MDELLAKMDSRDITEQMAYDYIEANEDWVKEQERIARVRCAIEDRKKDNGDI